MEVEIEQYRLKLQAIGWSQAALDKVFLTEMASLSYESARQSLFEEAFLFGSPLFQKLWSFECRAAHPQQAEQLLKLAMLYIDMPDELSGEAAEITHLLSRIATRSLLAPVFSNGSAGFFSSRLYCRQWQSKVKRSVAPVSLRHFQSAGPVD